MATIGTTPHVIYTCPTGLKARVLVFLYRPTGFGAGTLMRANVGGIRLREDTATSTTMFDALAGGSGLIITTGQTVTLDGDAGANNESAFFFVTVEEHLA